MQAAPARYVSVSELYSTDEVELLLDEIRELEPTSCCAEDIQDFEIAGSQTGGGAGGRSPVGTEHSWDSHAHYRRAPPPHPVPLAPLYCRLSYLITAAGFLRLLLIVSCSSACVCVWWLVGLRAWLLPLPERVRLLTLAALSSWLLHLALLLMHVTHLTQLLPLHWNKLGACLCAWSAVSLWCGASLLLHGVLATPEYRPAPSPVSDLLLAAAGLGMIGACAASLLTWLEGWRSRSPAVRRGSRALYRAVPHNNPL